MTTRAVALVLPPVQSFTMPYSAPAVLAAWLQERFAARTLVVDAGVEWLTRAVAGTEATEVLEDLRAPQTYRDMWSVRDAHLAAQRMLDELCAPYAPERVELSGRYSTGPTPTWEAVRAHLDLRRPSVFDDYVLASLIPRLDRFGAQIVGLSVPFDWMLLPTLRLTRLLATWRPDLEIVVGGHAVSRMWYEGNAEYFDLLEAGWVCVGDGQEAFTDLLRHLDDAIPLLPGGPLVRLPAQRLAAPRPGGRPGFLDDTTLPDFTDLELSAYLRPTPILPVPASDGCFFGACRFCSRQRSDQSVPYVERSPEQVAATMSGLADRHGVRQFILAEDILSHRFLLRLATELRGTPLTWFCEASFKAKLARRLTEEDCRLLHDGGSRLILNGLESASARMRDRMGCPVDIDDFDRTTVRLVEAGIVPYITMIFGYPGETSRDVRESAEFMRRHAHHAVFATSRYSIVPGTALADELAARPEVSCIRHDVLDGGLEMLADDTADAEQADRILTTALPGLFGPAAQYLRSIPVLMQMLDPVPRVPALRSTAESREDVPS